VSTITGKDKHRLASGANHLVRAMDQILELSPEVTVEVLLESRRRKGATIVEFWAFAEAVAAVAKRHGQETLSLYASERADRATRELARKHRREELARETLAKKIIEKKAVKA